MRQRILEHAQDEGGNVSFKTLWQRGWDSNSVALLNPHKLLILRGVTTATTPTIAQVGYSFGTHAYPRLSFGEADVSRGPRSHDHFNKCQLDRRVEKGGQAWATEVGTSPVTAVNRDLSPSSERKTAYLQQSIRTIITPCLGVHRRRCFHFRV